MADNSNLRLSTQVEVDQTLGQLERVWDDIGITGEQRDDRKRHFFGHVANLCEKILADELALKNRIITRIERNTRDILMMSEELCVEAEEAVEGLTLLELDEVLQERVAKLKQTKEERKETLRLLSERDQELCNVLGETPHYVPPDIVPSDAHLKEVEAHITAMEKEKAKREDTYHSLKAGVLEFLATLEHSPDDSFTEDLICTSSHQDIPLTNTYLHQLRNVHSELEFRIHENEARSLVLREEVSVLWVLLDVPVAHQQAFLATAPNHTPSHIAKLEEELERLRVLRGQNLERFMVRVRQETAEWWEKCYVDQETRTQLEELYEGEASEDGLAAYEAEMAKWKSYHKENADIFSVLASFMILYSKMLELEEKAKDPSRLFNTRGGALLQEEKAKKKVKTELPRVEERLREVAQEWSAMHEGRSFKVYGRPVLEYIDRLWESHDQRKEVEKTKRHQAKEGKRVPGAPTSAASRTPGPAPSSARKRGREGDDHSTTKKARQGGLGITLFRSPSKGALNKSPLKTPKQTPKPRPLSDRNTAAPSSLPPTTSTSIESSLQSTISYDKFEAGLGARRCEEVVHSSFLEGRNTAAQPRPLLQGGASPRPIQASAPRSIHPMTLDDRVRERRLRDTLHLASPHKQAKGGHRLFRHLPTITSSAASPSHPPSPVKCGNGRVVSVGSLRRTASQPCLVSGPRGPTSSRTANASPRYLGNPKFSKYKDHPLRFLI